MLNMHEIQDSAITSRKVYMTVQRVSVSNSV